MSSTTVFVNFNEYLGGGETLLLRMVGSFSHKKIKVISSKSSYIHDKLKNNDHLSSALLLYSNNYNFNYLSKKNKAEFLRWLDTVLPENELFKIVTFCMRDLHLLVSFMGKYKRKNINIIHLLLHPLDHLYLGQTITDKLILKAFGKNQFKERKNLIVNSAVLDRLEMSGALIPMNFNVLKRLEIDTKISIKPDKIIPLPFFREGDCMHQKVVGNNSDKQTKIVWLGRIVDFKIAAIKCMIDFVSTNENYSFDIIGYGSESLINDYISYKSVNDRVAIIGRVPHDELKKALANYDIGYGMGTSMAELTLCDLPSIVALASPDFKAFEQAISAGLVYEQKPGNVGDDLYRTNIIESTFPLIIDTIRKIEEDPQDCLNKSLDYLSNNFSLEKNISRYADVIESAPHTSFSGIKPLRVSLLRKVLFKALSVIK